MIMSFTSKTSFDTATTIANKSLGFDPSAINLVLVVVTGGKQS